MKANWTLLILLCLCWVVVWWLAFAAWGVTFSHNERMQFCADMAEFQGNTTDANILRLQVIVSGGTVWTDEELKRRKFWHDGFLRGYASATSVNVDQLASAWYMDQQCGELLKSLQADTVK